VPPGLEVVQAHDEESKRDAAADGVDQPFNPTSIQRTVDRCHNLIVAVAAYSQCSIFLQMVCRDGLDR